ncbi:hypothetical protein F4779DRAFT_619521 [Xylariaceae sp. FL0662B]|nr:hypothetical protein F4779DRAFT_619521 [Xylariaceae sp. FL0662B]
MSEIISQPSSPTEWEEYAQSDIVTSIPSRKEEREEQNTIIHRDVYVDESILSANSSTELLYIYTDVFAFTEPEITIAAPAYAQIQILARVITATTPVHLKVQPDLDAGYQIYVYTSILDQPITVSTGKSTPVNLELGPGTGNVGVLLSVHTDHINIKYQQGYAHSKDDDFQASLETQLRIAEALFWRSTSLSISLCSHVAVATANPAGFYPQINTQALALGQQLAAQAMTGPDMSYAPVLNIEQYKSTVRDALDTVSAFKEQYDRFRDKGQTLDDQKKAWDTMLQQASNQKGIHINLRNLAIAKYKDACTVVLRCNQQLKADNEEIDNAKSAFMRGIEAWEAAERLRAAFNICKAIAEFVWNLGKLCSGDASAIPDALSAIEDATNAIIEAEGIPNQVGVKIKSETLKNLGECMKALEELYPKMDELVQAVQQLESDPSKITDIPAFGNISGSSEGDADARAIIAIAAWDKWILESDQQLEFAMSQNIGGASEYRLALRKHGVNGKALAQAEAEAVKAGHEYIQAEMEVIGCDQDIAALKDLREKYQGQLDIYNQAEARFFGRYLGIRTSVAIEMRKMVWAYKYWALADSQVVLDSQKSPEGFRADLLMLDGEIEAIEERYATDFQPFTWTVSSNDLPSNYGSLMIEGLKSEDHSASFTLRPSSDPNNEENFASIFVDGSHFRLDGLETFLSGATPRPEYIKNGVVQVDIQILTSGIYADIQDNKVFNFTSLPRSVRLSYDLMESGEQGETHIHATFPTEQHAEPTPFTQWTMKLLHPEKLDLSGLDKVNLQWTGKARYSLSSRREHMSQPVISSSVSVVAQ